MTGPLGDAEPFQTLLIDIRYVCDGEPDCSDSSDEFCANTTEVPTVMPGACPGLSPFEWECADKELCILYGQVCDSIIDCTDGSDEKECGQSYRVQDLMVDPKTVTPFNFTLSWKDLTVPGRTLLRNTIDVFSAAY